MSSVKRNGVVSGVVLAFFVIFVAGAFALASKQADPADAATAKEAGTGKLVRADSHRLGAAGTGKAILVEFLDFECESCRAAYPIVEELRTAYAGKVDFVVRYFPIPSHANAMNAALAVEAASQQGKFEAMYQRLYDTQQAWGSSRSPRRRCSAPTPRTSVSTWPPTTRPSRTKPPRTESNGTGRTASTSAWKEHPRSSSTAKSSSHPRSRTSAPRSTPPSMAEPATSSATTAATTLATTPATSPAAIPASAAVGRGTAWTLTLAALGGLVAAFVLLVEKFALLTDPTYVPSCSINPVLSCGSIMNTGQAAVFGFPNPILGVAGFAALLTIGVVLQTRAALPGWFWWAIQAGTALGVVFVHWLIFQSLYRIGALCPYCMIVWVATITAFVAATAHNIRTGQIPGPKRLRTTASYAPTVVTVWLVAIAAVITIKFWDYWVTLIP